MKDTIKYLASSDYFVYGLIALLVVLIILFFVVLLSGRKKDTTNLTKKDNDEENNIEIINSPVNQDINFDHNEYVKETTAEFELAPVEEIMPNTSEEIPEVNEESQALKIESTGEIPVLKDFSFDELSKSISDELDKLKEEEENGLTSSPFINDEKINEVNVTGYNELADKILATDTVFAKNTTPVITEEIELPKLASDVKEEKPLVNEPVIKEEEVPLFARFNNETYELNKKD